MPYFKLRFPGDSLPVLQDGLQFMRFLIGQTGANNIVLMEPEQILGFPKFRKNLVYQVAHPEPSGKFQQFASP